MPRRSSRNSRASARRSVNKAEKRGRKDVAPATAPASSVSLSLSSYDDDYTPPRVVQTSGLPGRTKQTSETDGSPTTDDLGRSEEVSEVGESHRRPIRFSYIAAGCPLRCDFTNDDQSDNVAKGQELTFLSFSSLLLLFSLYLSRFIRSCSSSSSLSLPFSPSLFFVSHRIPTGVTAITSRPGFLSLPLSLSHTRSDAHTLTSPVWVRV